LSYEATDVGSWSSVGSNEPLKNECELIYEIFQRRKQGNWKKNDCWPGGHIRQEPNVVTIFGTKRGYWSSSWWMCNGRNSKNWCS